MLSRCYPAKPFDGPCLQFSAHHITNEVGDKQMTATTTTTDLANVPHPAGAVHVAEWDGLEFDAPRRYFRGSSRVVEREGDIDKDITVEIYGSQGRPVTSRGTSW
jgi:hypothetical protein